MKNTDSKSPGNTLTASEWNEGINEILNVILALGQSLSSGDLDQLGKSIAGYVGSGDYYDDVGGADAYSLATVGLKEGPTVYEDGLVVRFRPGNANTGVSTVTVNALGVKTITHEDGSALVAGDLITTADAMMRYAKAPTDKFQLLNASLPVISNTMKQGYIDGFLHSNNGATPLDKVDIGVGICRDSTDATDIVATAGFTKDIKNAWSVGTAGGFPTGLTLAADTWYRLFVISKTDGTNDFGWDRAADAGDLLTDASDYSFFRQIGWTLTDTGPDIIAYIQNSDDLDEVLWDVIAEDITVIATSASVTTPALSAPPNAIARFIARLNVLSGLSTSGLFTDTRQTPTTPAFPGPWNIVQNVSASFVMSVVNFAIQTDSASQIQVEFDNALGNYEVQTYGYRYRRGKQ